MYTDQQKREIERVLTVFNPFIDQADYLEIVWSNKRFTLPKRFATSVIPRSATTSFSKTTASMNFGRCISWSETSFCAAFSRMMHSCRSITT